MGHGPPRGLGMKAAPRTPSQATGVGQGCTVGADRVLQNLIKACSLRIRGVGTIPRSRQCKLLTCKINCAYAEFGGGKRRHAAYVCTEPGAHAPVHIVSVRTEHLPHAPGRASPPARFRRRRSATCWPRSRRTEGARRDKRPRPGGPATGPPPDAPPPGPGPAL
uniref:Uncharacterized protein n=1 Tax=Rangifer tarandus platyrhynchus TaxID=3082113 RepID=A0ACB0F854_RANTA|nr:unnamed protein product [Rangifer tarandus platyrhynchus]